MHRLLTPTSRAALAALLFAGRAAAAPSPIEMQIDRSLSPSPVCIYRVITGPCGTIGSITSGGAFTPNLTSGVPTAAQVTFQPISGSTFTAQNKFRSLEIASSDVGIKCDGTTDDGPAINAIVGSLNTAFKPTIIFPGNGAVCAIGTTIAALGSAWNNTSFQGGGVGKGAGTGVDNSDNTIFKWTGSTGGTMLDWSTSGAGGLTSSASIRGITFDGNGTAAKGLNIIGAFNTTLDIKVRNVSGSGVYTDINPAGGADVQHNSWHILGEMTSTAAISADVLTIGPGNSYNDFHHNHVRLSAVVQNGNGITCGNADSNFFPDVQIQVVTPGTNTSKGLEIKGAAIAGQECRANHFGHFDSIPGVYVDNAAHPGYNNGIDYYVTNSGEPSPSFASGALAAGATLWWNTDLGAHLNQLGILWSGSAAGLDVNGGLSVGGGAPSSSCGSLTSESSKNFFTILVPPGNVTSCTQTWASGQWHTGMICHYQSSTGVSAWQSARSVMTSTMTSVSSVGGTAIWGICGGH